MGALGREISRRVWGGLRLHAWGTASRRLWEVTPPGRIAGLDGWLMRREGEGKGGEMKKVQLDSKNWSPDEYWCHGPSDHRPHPIPRPPTKENQKHRAFTITVCFTIIEKTSPLPTLHVVHQVGQWLVSCPQFRLGSLTGTLHHRGLSLLQQSYFLSFPGCLFHMPTRKWICYSFLVCFSERDLLGANMIISITDIKMLL